MSHILLLGTHNRKKREELKDLLKELDLDIRDLTDFPDVPEVIEDGKTFQENAEKKATAVARFTSEWTLGEDSGLVVPALNGRPGVHSARYAGKHGDDEANNDKLLAELAPLPDEKRSAYYVCCIALADPLGTVKAIVEGRCHGRIAKERRGTNGFGYDPLFLIPELHRTFGELSPRVKQALSHRSRALMKLRPVIRHWLRVE